MEVELLASINQYNCKHEKHRKYTQRRFDMLNDFEIIEVNCSKCHKTLELMIKKITSPSSIISPSSST